MKLFRRNKSQTINELVENTYNGIPDNELLNKLREDISELKKLDYKEPNLRHTLNDFLLKDKYSRIPNHMQLFTEFFSCVDRDYGRYCSASSSCELEEIDCVLKILQNFRNDIAEKYDVMKRESELRKEIQTLKNTLEIE
jgi:hypothetical protein